MGNKNSHKVLDSQKCIITFNSKYAKKPNEKKRYETILYNHLYDKHRMVTQEELYDFALVDYNIYIEVDEEQHLSSGKSKKKENQTRRDKEKIVKCLNKPATLLRISWFSIENGQYVDIINYCLSHMTKIENKLVLSSKEIYGKLDMLTDINKSSIFYYK